MTSGSVVSFSNKELSPRQLMQRVRQSFKTSWTPAIWGPPGIAKSQVIRTIADEEGVALYDMRLSQFAPEDLRGIPFPEMNFGFKGLAWHPPIDFPRDLDYDLAVTCEAEEDTLVRIYNPRSTRNHIFYCTSPEVRLRPFDPSHTATLVRWDTDAFDNTLHDRFFMTLHDGDGKPVAGRVRVYVKGKVRTIWALEEFNSAIPSVLAACYELVLDRSLGGYTVPDGVKLIATGNNDTDGGVTYKLPRPIANRLVNYAARMEFEDWSIWAVTTIHPAVLSFIERFPRNLGEDKARPDEKAFATARSWHMLSDHIAKNPDASVDDVRDFTLACVGSQHGPPFIEHFKNIADNPVSIDDILSGRQIKVPMNKSARVYLGHYLRTHLCQTLKERYDRLQIDRSPTSMRRRTATPPELQDWYQQADNFVGFLQESLTPETMLAGLTAALRQYGLVFTPKMMPRFNDFVGSDMGMLMAKVDLK